MVALFLFAFVVGSGGRDVVLVGVGVFVTNRVVF